MAIDPQVWDACRSFARRWGGRDADNAHGEALLGVLRAEAGGHVESIGQAINAGRWAILDRIKAEAADRRRAYATARSVELPAPDLAESLDPPQRSRYLDAISEAQRAVVELHLWGELTLPQTARELGITERAARTRYSKAIARLRERFA